MICFAQEVIQGPRESREGVSIITESVNEHRCITGTSRCMRGNFSPASREEADGGGRAGVKSDCVSKPSE